MRRAVLLLVVAAAVLALAGGVVLAAPAICPGGGGDCVGSRVPDTLSGTSSDDQIAAMEGDDTITEPQATGDNDEIYGDEGNDIIDDSAFANDEDLIFGDEGNDTIDVQEQGAAGADTVNCGPGKRDRVFFEAGHDIINKNCEIRKGA